LLRDAAVRAPHYSLRDLAKLDQRIEAHLDGLRIAGDAGWDAVARELSWKKPGEVFAAAVLTFESDRSDRIEPVVDVATKDPSLIRALISALGWLPFERVEDLIRTLLAAADPTQQIVGVRAGAAHRWAETLRLAPAAPENPALRIAQIRASGELARVGPGRNQMAADGEDLVLYFWSAWASAMLGDARATSRLCEHVTAGGPYADRALEVAGRAMSPLEVHDWFRNLAAKPETLLYATRLVGVQGDSTLVPWLIEQMSVPDLARAAGESFVLITGAELEDGLEGEWPEGFEVGPSEDPSATDVSMDLDEDLVWPQPIAVEKWWAKNRQRFPEGQRFLLGRPLSEAVMAEVLRTGSQRQRAAAALEIKLRHPEQALFEVRAPAKRQQQLLGLK
jgi:uncharacterized protein (TIGR02270 family)